MKSSNIVTGTNSSLRIRSELDSDGELEMDFVSLGKPSTWLSRYMAISLIQHLIEVFDISIDEVRED